MTSPRGFAVVGCPLSVASKLGLHDLCSFDFVNRQYLLRPGSYVKSLDEHLCGEIHPQYHTVNDIYLR